MAENSPSIATDITVCIKKPKHILNRINPKKSIPRHTIINLPETKGKEKNLESSEKQYLIYKGSLELMRTHQIRTHGSKKEVAQYFSSVGRKELSTQNSTPSKKYPSESKEEIKAFSDEKNTMKICHKTKDILLIERN